MTQPGKATAVATQESVGESTADIGLRSLNPADGLFLRAEHLNQIQEYARELARVGAIATGTGVAYGYGLSVDGTDLHIAPGLAIDPSGRALRSRVAVTLDLSALTIRDGRFWVVEVTSAPPVPAGNEPIFGELCADPCAAGATIQPWLDDAVRVQVTPNDTLAGLKGVDPHQQRSWLASAYFEQERRAGKPWLTPGADGTVAPILGRPWQAAVPGGEPAGGAAVPIGALLHVDGQWVLDVWIARRDLVAAPARTGWESRLSLRPWELFLAQVLQFQAQLAQVSPSASGGMASVADVERLYTELLRNKRRPAGELEGLFGAWREQHQSPVVPESLAGQGFQELPPAGFLPVAAGPDIADRVCAMFGTVNVTVRRSSADAALRAVAVAQHLDRIPLTLDGGGDNPAVEVWIPDVPADLPEVTTLAYGWVAFVRDRTPVVVPASASVDVVEVHAQPDLVGSLTGFADQLPTADVPFATLTYPPREWAVPTKDDRQAGLIEAKYSSMPVNSDLTVGFIGTYADEKRRPLALVRAAALAVWLKGTDAPSAMSDVLVGTDVVVVKAVEGQRESIWLVLVRTNL